MGSCLCFAAFFLSIRVCMCSKLQEWIFSLFLFESVQALEWEKSSHSKMALSRLNKSLELSSWQPCDSIAVHVVDGDNFVRLIRQKRWWERESPNQNRIDDKMFKTEFTGFLLHFYVWFYASFMVIFCFYCNLMRHKLHTKKRTRRPSINKCLSRWIAV